MRARTERTQLGNSQAATGVAHQSASLKATGKLEDKRPVAVAQQKLQQIANSRIKAATAPAWQPGQWQQAPGLMQRKKLVTSLSMVGSYQAKIAQLMGRNVLYRGPEHMVKMYRGSDYAWELRYMQTGRIMTKGLREFYGKQPLEMAAHTMGTNSDEFAHLAPRELRNRHAISSAISTNGEANTPTSNYASLVRDPVRAAQWATRIFRFDVWRSDLWQGGVDYDRGGPEGEWLVEGDTRLYNIETSVDGGQTWEVVNQVLDNDSTFYERSQHVR